MSTALQAACFRHYQEGPLEALGKFDSTYLPIKRLQMPITEICHRLRTEPKALSVEHRDGILVLVKNGRRKGAKNEALNDDVWHHQTYLTFVWERGIML